MLAVAEQPLADIIVLMRDLGVRNSKELYPLLIEHIHWRKHLVRIKTPKPRPESVGFPCPLAQKRSCASVVATGQRAGCFLPSREGKHITSGLVSKQ